MKYLFSTSGAIAGAYDLISTFIKPLTGSSDPYRNNDNIPRAMNLTRMCEEHAKYRIASDHGANILLEKSYCLDE